MISKQKAVFEGRSLSLDRGDGPIFKDLSFSLASQETMALVGGNGSGKTSLLRLMATLLRPTKGYLAWKQKKLTLLDPSLKKNLIYLGHVFGLKSTVKVSNMLSFFRDVSNSDYSIDEIIYYWELEKVKNQKISEISLGCQKKIALSRLNFNLKKEEVKGETVLWLLDEPFTALDKVSQQKLCWILENHLKRGGILVFSSHQDQFLSVNHRVYLENEVLTRSIHG